MDFSFNEEQTLLQESVQRFIQNDYTFESRQRALATDTGYGAAAWQQFADLGWLALPFAEEDGGIGGGPIETMILMEEFGKGLVIEPYLSSIVLFGGVLAAVGSAEQKQAILPDLMAGSRQGALAFVEPQARFDLANVTTAARADGADFVIDGAKAVVLGGPTADWFIVPARTAGEQRDAEGVTLFLVESSATGVGRRDYPTVDGFRASEVTFDGVRVSAGALLGGEGGGVDVLERTLAGGILAVGAEAVGAMEVLYRTTVEYCKTREQFGQPIGKFQVLQHRMVDMFMEHEQAKSLLYMAAMKLDAGDGVEARKACSALKVQVGKGGRFVGQNAVQLHGGMGMTEELAVGHYFKRLTVIDTLFGNVDHHLKRYARAA